jgi:flagellar basal-body rod protein FlgF
MDNPGYIALSQQMVLRRQMDLIANNLANITTPAFKAESMLFVEQMQPTYRHERLSFVQDLAAYRDVSEGPLTPTNNPLDVAISGSGYFVVDTPEGQRYTRHGAFRLDGDGQIVTGRGDRVLDDRGSPLQVPPETTTIDIAADGTISADRDQIGRIAVVQVANEQALRKVEAGLYAAVAEQPVPVEEVAVLQGMLEQSNVQGVVEITRLIDTARTYQLAAKLADQEHERQRRAIQALISA